MPTQVRLHQLSDLANEESSNEIFLETTIYTKIQVIVEGDETLIKLPYGNKFDIIDGTIVIHEKRHK